MKKSVNVPTNLSKLSKVVDNDVFKKTVYDKLFTKVNTIDTNDTSKLVTKLSAAQKFKKL